MKTLKYMMVAMALQAACMAVADMIPGDWRVDVGKRSVFRKEIYQGESVRLEATFFRNGKEFTPDFAAPMLYWQTNGMGRSYFSAPAVVSSNAVCAVWDGSKDCGARYYHGFIGETGVTYRAEFEFKMVPSPGFAPNVLPLPVQVLDFAAVEVANAPWPSAESVAIAVAAATNATLAAAKGYTDGAVAGAITPSMVTNIVEAIAPAPGDYANVSNRSVNAVQKGEDLELKGYNGSGEEYGFKLGPDGGYPWNGEGWSTYESFVFPIDIVSSGGDWNWYQIFSDQDDPDEYAATLVRRADLHIAKQEVYGEIGNRGYLTSESDPTVPAWAKNPTPPATSLEPATNYTDGAVAAIREYCDLYVRNTNCWMVVSNGVFSVYSVSGDAHVKVWEWDATSSNRFAALADQTAAATNALSRRIDAAPARWSDFAADGTANPYPYAVCINRPAVFGDGSVLWEGTNGFFALSAAAPICAGGTSAAFRIGTDADTFFGMEVAASYFVGIFTGGITVAPDSSAVTLTYMWADSYTNAPPAVYYAATPADEFRDVMEVEGLSRLDTSSPGVSYSVTVSGLTGSQGFFTAKREVQGGAVMRSTLPIFADGYYIAPSNAAPQIVQPDSVFTISAGGHTYRVFGERID